MGLGATPEKPRPRAPAARSPRSAGGRRSGGTTMQHLSRADRSAAAVRAARAIPTFVFALGFLASGHDIHGLGRDSRGRIAACDQGATPSPARSPSPRSSSTRGRRSMTTMASISRSPIFRIMPSICRGCSSRISRRWGARPPLFHDPARGAPSHLSGGIVGVRAERRFGAERRHSQGRLRVRRADGRRRPPDKSKVSHTAMALNNSAIDAIAITQGRRSARAVS